MNYFVVIDTNVLVSALLSRHDNAATVKIMNAFFDGLIIPVFNDEILAEYDNVLHRPKFKFADDAIQLLLGAIRTQGLFVEQLDSGIELPDPKDLLFYEVVLASQKNHAYLVTGNSKHFPHEPFIVTPNELLDIMK